MLLCLTCFKSEKAIERAIQKRREQANHARAEQRIDDRLPNSRKAHRNLSESRPTPVQSPKIYEPPR
jgi:hypothetical protein